MRRITVTLLLAGLVAAGLGPAGAHTGPGGGGYENPESVLWDGEAGAFYVTNFGGAVFNPAGREPDGYLTRLTGEGRLRDERWVGGLRTPKGMRRSGAELFVADVGQVVVIDIASGTISRTVDLDAIGAQFPNDVAVDAATGDVFVSDLLRNAIYRLPGGTGAPEVWLETPDLESPNGLLVDGPSLVVASFGRDLDPATFAVSQPGRVLVVDLATRTVAPLGAMAPTGGLDGIERLGDTYLVTDNPGGRLLSVALDGSVTVVADDLPGAADLGLRRGDRTAAVPLLRESVVRFLRVP